MIVACTILYNRLDLLEIWLNELKGHVDKFVIVEGNRTHVGGYKDFIYDKTQFSDFNIEYIPITDIPDYDKKEFDRIEKYINNYLLNVLKCNDNDLILFTHGDEIVKGDILDEASYYITCELNQNMYSEIVCRFHLLQCRYYLNCVLKTQKGFDDWGPYLTTFRVFKEVGPWRIKHLYNGSPCLNFSRAGWHYSWLGPKKYIYDKLLTNVDRSYIEEYMLNYDYIQEIMDTGGDIIQEKRLLPDKKWIGMLFFNPTDELITRFLIPKTVRENIDKYKELIKYEII